MHEVRIRLNYGEGTLWWAESDNGFVGGADRLADLRHAILEWAEAEGLTDAIHMRLLANERAGYEGISPEVSPKRPPLTMGLDAVRVERVLSPA